MYGIVVFALIAAVSCNDLIQGPKVGRPIYNDTKEASPAIWKQMDEVTIKANDTDVISRIVITDLRPNKDGEAKIIEGGPGQKNVTLELKSPTIFRGYDFHIEVYVVDENEQGNFPEMTTEVPMVTEIPEMENDTKVPQGVDTTESNKSVTDKTSEVQDKIEAPVITDKKSKNTDETVDPIVQYVRENTEKDSQGQYNKHSEGSEMANITPADEANVASFNPHLVSKYEEFKKEH